MNNNSIKKDSIDKIQKSTFKEAIYLCYKNGITSVAPLGFSGDTIIIHGSQNQKTSRVSQVSIRNYCGDAELLITDKDGRFLFYGRLSIDLGIDFVVNNYWQVFKRVKKNILKSVPRISEFKDIKIPEDAKKTIGFEMLKTYQINHPFYSL